MAKLSLSAKKVVSLLDEVKTTACSKTLLLCGDPNLLQSFLIKYPKLAEPINAIIQSHIQSLLAPLPFLSGIKESQQRLLAAMCRYEAFDANQVVFEENAPGSKLYIVLDGVAKVMSNSGNNRNNVKALCRSLEFDKVNTNNQSSSSLMKEEDGLVELATLKAGDYFGETALIVDIPRTTTVKTVSKALFVTVDKMDFANFFKVCPIKEAMTKVTIERMLCKLSVLGIPFLHGIPDEKLKSFADSSKLHELAHGDVVFKQGEYGDRFYIVVHGEVKIETRNDPVMKEETSKQDPESSAPLTRRVTNVGKLGAGKYFGEMALVTDKGRSATVLSHGTSILLSIDKASFHNIFGTNTLAISEFELRVLKGSIELHHLLDHPNGIPAFKAYLEKTHAGENIDFWLRVNSFQDIYENENLKEKDEKNNLDDASAKIWDEARDIYVTFCDENAQTQINIPCAIRINLKKAIFERDENEDDMIPADVFDSAKKEIYKIMVRDSYPRFKASSEFKVHNS